MNRSFHSTILGALLILSISNHGFSFISTNPGIHNSSGLISSRVWLDKNGNGLQDPEDTGIPGITVLLFNQLDLLSGITTTDNLGYYTFTNIPAGNYRLKFPKIQGLKITKQYAGSPHVDSDIDRYGYTKVISIGSNQTVDNIDAGYRGDLVINLSSSVHTCLGNQTTLDANVLKGKPPYTFTWSHGLGTGQTKNVAPVSNTIYRVTVTDYWGNEDNGSITVRVKSGVGEEQCHVIDNFKNGGSTNSFFMQVSPLDPGPKSVSQSAPIGLLGNSRNIVFEHLSGTLPASISINMGTGVFTSSNDVGTKSRTILCYNNNGQGINFDLSPFDYLKFQNIEIDQGGLDIDVSFWDGFKRVNSKIKIPESGVGTSLSHELVFANIPDLQTINIEKIQEICFEFTVSEESVDYQLVSLMTCKSTDCGLEMEDELEICSGESVEIEAKVPCAEQLIYLWDKGLPNQAKHIVSPAQTTVYNVTILDIDGCSVSGSIRVVVHPGPTVSLGQDFDECFGQVITIIPNVTGGSSPFNYEWSNGSAASSLTDQVALADTEYKVTVTDAHSCQDSAAVRLTVFENPDIAFTTTPADCQVSNGAATVIPSGGLAPYFYKWNDGSTEAILQNVASGFYTVTLTDSNGCETSGQVYVNELFCAKIGDFVWHDLNANGIQDANEPGVQGVRVELLDAAFSLISFTLTNASGYYMFSALPPGDYYVRFLLPDGFHYSPANQGSDPLKDSNSHPVTGMSNLINLENYEEDLSIDAGIYQSGRIGDLVWLDNNGNGLQDAGEPGIPGVSISLLDCTGNAINTIQTDENGSYSFANLVPGNYKVRFNVPAGMKFTTPNQGTNDTIDSDPAILTGETLCISITSNQTDLTIDAGLYFPVSIGDKVWVDLNANGVQDAGEPGVPDFGVRLLDCNGNLLKTTVTNAGGYYLFNDLIPGNYRIGYVTLGSFELSPYQTGDPVFDSDIDPATGTSVCAFLESGEINLSYDIGLFERAAIGDYVWIDSNGNGIQDAAESGFGGMLVQLFDCSGNLIDHQHTNSNGYYAFTDLMPGDYSIKFNLSASWNFTLPGLGISPQHDSNANQNTGFTACETLISGEVNTSYDAGIFQLAKIGNYVWQDSNGNGLQNTGEPGVGNFKVMLKTCSGTLLQIDYTDQYGYYLFENLLPGNYIIDFSDNVDAYFTQKNQGNNPEIDSDADQTTGQTSCIPLTSGMNELAIDAGLLNVSSVGDYVWEDINGNGIQEAGEPGIEGILVRLYLYAVNGTTYIGQTTTDANGHYIFENLAPGTYHIKLILGGTPWQATIPNVMSEDVDSDITHVNGFNSTSNFVLLPGQHNPDIDAGLYICAEIGDLVWCDHTPNHYWESGENGINGVQVQLFRNVNETWTLWETTTTQHQAGSIAGDGYWSVCTLPGEYYVQYNLPPNSNFLLVDPFIGGDPEIDSDVTNAFGYGTTDAFSVLSGENKTDLGAGYYYGSIIGDKVWFDTNLNGLQDTGEPNASGILVEIFNETGKVAQRITNSAGQYTFDNLEPGSYYLKFSPGTYSFTVPDTGVNDQVDSDVTHTNGPGTTNWFEVGVQEINFSYDAGLINTTGRMQWYDQGGSYKGNHNEVWWETLGEEIIENFELQRLNPGSEQFDLLDIIQPKGNRDLIETYKALDYDIDADGLYKYRIMSKDLFSNTDFSPEILIHVFGEMKLILYPNPAKDQLYMSFYNTHLDAINISVFNNLGVAVKAYLDITLEKNSFFHKEIPLSDLPSGNYHVKITGQDFSRAANISVIR